MVTGLLRMLAPLFGLPRLEEVHRLGIHLGALDRVGRLFGLSMVIVALSGVVWWFYMRRQPQAGTRRRVVLALLRGSLCLLLALMLADPQLHLIGMRQAPPRMVWLVDNSDSMNLADGGPSSIRQAAVRQSVSRRERVQAWLRGPGRELMQEIRRRTGAEHEAVVFSGEGPAGLRIFTPNPETGLPEWHKLDRALDGLGDSTSLSGAIGYLTAGNAARVATAAVILSDFGHNQGESPLDALPLSPIEGQPTQPIHTVGLGAIATRDLAVEIISPGRMKRGERSSVRIKISQQDLDARQVTVQLQAQRIEGGRVGEFREIASRQIKLDRSVEYLEIPVVPDSPGTVRLTASAAAQPGETLSENNQAWQDVSVVDDFLRLTYVAYEPTWEWRFIKEVFYRDPLVGTRGLRTFLDSSSPRVREQTPLFLPTLAMPRSDFFPTDVLFLGDMPGHLLTDRFCRMVEEFVGKFGGGLVVLAGPRFGPRELAGTPIETMLPVVLSGELRRQDGPVFSPRLTPQGLATPFMQLGDDSAAAQQAWDHLQGLTWYQPSARLHPLATALAVHPTERGVDDQPQPLIATRRYGRGEVIYLAFDETWRLRRLFGEAYYRQFWSQVINHLALGHPLGPAKRFSLHIAQQPYQPGDITIVELEAYDRQYQPLRAAEVPDGFMGRVTMVPDTLEASIETEVVFEYVADGRWVARIPADKSGHWRISVEDPIDGFRQEVAWSVAASSLERQSPVRNASLQKEIAQATGGMALELDQMQQWAREVELPPAREPIELTRPLWQTPVWFVLGAGMLLTEWWLRYRWRLA